MNSEELLMPRESGKFIAENANDITVDETGIEKCAHFILKRILSQQLHLTDLFKKTEIHPRTHFQNEENDKNAPSEIAPSKEEEEKKAVNWIVFVNTLNFSFWNHDNEPQYEVTYKGPKYTGYLSLCAAVNRTLDQDVPLTNPEFYSQLKPEDLNKFLMGDNGVPCPMIQQRWECLEEVANVLKEKYNGSAIELIKSAQNSAQKLLKTLTTDFKCFQDWGIYHNQRVSFHKRAQILISDLWNFYEGKNLGHFKDIESLTMFADYRVPQSLQYFGVMKYSEALLNRLKNCEKDLLENGSDMEIEIRGCSIRAVELITNRLKQLLGKKPGNTGNEDTTKSDKKTGELKELENQPNGLENLPNGQENQPNGQENQPNKKSDQNMKPVDLDKPNGTEENKSLSVETPQKPINSQNNNEKANEKQEELVNDMLIDYFLWSFRREKAEEMKKYPFHKTRSIFY